MKRIIAVWTLIACVMAVPSAIAGGMNRSPIDRLWKKELARQEIVDQRLDRIEREASQGLADLRRGSDLGSGAGQTVKKTR
jgi:hypothetical protein